MLYINFVFIYVTLYYLIVIYTMSITWGYDEDIEPNLLSIFMEEWHKRWYNLPEILDEEELKAIN